MSKSKVDKAVRDKLRDALAEQEAAEAEKQARIKFSRDMVAPFRGMNDRFFAVLGAKKLEDGTIVPVYMAISRKAVKGFEIEETSCAGWLFVDGFTQPIPLTSDEMPAMLTWLQWGDNADAF